MKKSMLLGLILGLCAASFKIFYFPSESARIVKSPMLSTPQTSQIKTTIEQSQPNKYPLEGGFDPDSNQAEMVHSQELDSKNASGANASEESAGALKIETIPVTPEQQLVNEWNAHYTPPEPTDENAIEWINTPHADQVHLVNDEQHCMENCADELNVSFESVGEFADQINSSALKALAEKEGLLLDEHDAIALKESSSLPGPPTEDGAWVEPP
jgi:hypothetical protein